MTKLNALRIRRMHRLLGIMRAVVNDLRAYGRPDKADELAGAASMLDDWITEIKAEQGEKTP